jgi:hypothetical protein
VTGPAHAKPIPMPTTSPTFRAMTTLLDNLTSSESLSSFSSSLLTRSAMRCSGNSSSACRLHSPFPSRRCHAGYCLSEVISFYAHCRLLEGPGSYLGSAPR